MSMGDGVGGISGSELRQDAPGRLVSLLESSRRHDWSVEARKVLSSRNGRCLSLGRDPLRNTG